MNRRAALNQQYCQTLKSLDSDASTHVSEAVWGQWYDSPKQSSGFPLSSQLQHSNEIPSHHPITPPSPSSDKDDDPAVGTGPPNSARHQWHSSAKQSWRPPSPSLSHQFNEVQSHHDCYPSLPPSPSLVHHSDHPAVTTQDLDSAWRQCNNIPAHPQRSAWSPYVPLEPLDPETRSYHHLPAPTPRPGSIRSLSHPPSPHLSVPTTYGSLSLISETQPRDDPNPTNPQPSSHHETPNLPHTRLSWHSQDYPSLDHQTSHPEARVITPRGALDSHTSPPSFSHVDFSGSTITSATYRKCPQQWRRDFKFKSGFASIFCRMLNTAVNSAKLDLHPLLCHSKFGSMIMYNLCREPDTLMLPDLDHAQVTSYMNQSVTYPATQHMRIYHPRLPWYIDIKANGAPYVSLGIFFRQLFSALSMPVSDDEFYSVGLDDEDRRVLTCTCFDRCRSEGEKRVSVKRVDFLRGEFEWKGLVAGKQGMWCLKTS